MAEAISVPPSNMHTPHQKKDDFIIFGNLIPIFIVWNCLEIVFGKNWYAYPFPIRAQPLEKIQKINKRQIFMNPSPKNSDIAYECSFSICTIISCVKNVYSLSIHKPSLEYPKINNHIYIKQKCWLIDKSSAAKLQKLLPFKPKKFSKKKWFSKTTWVGPAKI